LTTIHMPSRITSFSDRSRRLRAPASAGFSSAVVDGPEQVRRHVPLLASAYVDHDTGRRHRALADADEIVSRDHFSCIFSRLPGGRHDPALLGR
jgi:hypothetical protein